MPPAQDIPARRQTHVTWKIQDDGFFIGDTAASIETLSQIQVVSKAVDILSTLVQPLQYQGEHYPHVSHHPQLPRLYQPERLR
jgi:hypothetical protein